jgi:hypothetical protein
MQTTVAVSSLHSGERSFTGTAIAPKSRERASADVVPRATDLRGAQRARNVAPDGERKRLLVSTASVFRLASHTNASGRLTSRIPSPKISVIISQSASGRKVPSAVRGARLRLAAPIHFDREISGL